MTLPKITSHNTGCAARVNNSSGSWRSFRNSASETANTCVAKSTTGFLGLAVLSNTSACKPDIAIIPSRFDISAGQLFEDVVQCSLGPDGGLQLGRSSDQLNA